MAENKKKEGKKSFSFLDTNNDGKVSVDEITESLGKIGHQRSKDQVDSMLNKIDENNDGTLDLTEFINSLSSQESKLTTAFKMLDKDRDGKINATEIQRMSTELGEPLSDEKTDDLINTYDGDGDGRLNFQEFGRMMKGICPKDLSKDEPQAVLPNKGVSDLWNKVDHIALVVSDVGRSAAFYGSKLGMIQVHRPDFDRFGAWFTMGNINLHLIKGRPAVHADDDLIVSHFAINVGTTDDMKILMERLDGLGVKYRENVSVPNPGDGSNVQVKQAFVRDPDGYYMEFCSCKTLEVYLDKMVTEYEAGWDLYRTAIALEMKSMMAKWRNAQDETSSADPVKLENLLKRQKIFGDITQSASPDQLKELLALYHNDIPAVIAGLKAIVKQAGGQKFIPPAFFDRDEQRTFKQPPSFQLDANAPTF